MRIKQLIMACAISLFVLAGCTPITPSGTAINTPGAAAATTNPPNPTSQKTAAASSTSSPSATQTGQTPPATVGWKQYHNPQWRITLAYPTDWSVSGNNGKVTFKSPSGGTIQLDQIQANNLSSQDFLNQNQIPNTRCSRGENPENVQYRSCFDTIAFSTTAYLVITPSQGAPQFFTLSTFERGDLEVFNSMLASFQPS